jgi:outer membrane translocation and assembly module TamA
MLYLFDVSKIFNWLTSCIRLQKNNSQVFRPNCALSYRWQSRSKVSIVVPVFLLLVLFNVDAIAQQTYSLTINGLPNKRKTAYKKIFIDSSEVIKQVDSVVLEIKLNGYFNASITDFKWNNKSLEVNLISGTPYKLYHISNGNINPSAINFHKSINKQTWNVGEIKSLYNQVLNWYENNGHPFAQVWLDSFSFDKENVTAKLFCKPNTKIYIDSVSIIGNARLSNKYLYASLDIKPNDIYQENKIALIDKRLQSLNIISLQRSSEIAFAADKATINLFINQKNANQFDGIIGFLPSADGKKLQLTGDFKLKLQNALKRGELIDLTYRGLPNQSQQLLTQISYPYLFLSKIGLDLDFQLFRKDTTFLNLNTKLGVSFAFTPERSVHFFVESYKGNLISSNKSNVTSSLPPFVNIASTYYGIGGSLEKVDNSLLPKKGYRLNFSASVGERKINKDKGFDPADFPQINSKNTQYKLNADLNYYKKITQKLGLYLRNQAALISGNNIFENEAYRIGGFKILRGFNEQSILVSSYTVQTLEARYFIERNSFLFGFYDQGWIKQSFVTGQKNDIPASFGAGINFETKLGIMSLSYALGKQQNNPLNLQKGNIHFGLVSYF